MPSAQANGLALEYETFGNEGDPVILLIMGLGMQMIAWLDPFCTQLAAQGYRVIRYDNRDVGLSTKFEAAGVADMAALMMAMMMGKKPAVPYTLDDMAADAVGLLDALGIERLFTLGQRSVAMGGRHFADVDALIAAVLEPLRAPPANFEGAARAHFCHKRFELAAQGHRLSAGLPGVGHLVLGGLAGHAGQVLPHEVHTGRDDQAVVGQLAAAGQPDHALVGVDAGHRVAHQADAVALFQVVVGRGDVGQGLGAVDHQVGDGAGDEVGVGLDQGDVDRVVREQAQVLGSGGASVATTDHHHLGAAAARGGAAREGTQARHGGTRSQRLYKMTTLHGGAPHFFWAAK